MLVEKPSIRRALSDLKRSLNNGSISSSRPWEDFIFLCGASGKDAGTISFRRQAVANFIKNKIPHSKVLLAEKVFEVLQHEGHSGNLLDIEASLISKFTDHIIIILESNSAFCELGAFSFDEKIRSKIIVINDEHHKDSKSFINLGPIKAISESKVSVDGIFHYKMDNRSSVGSADGIGIVFHLLYERLMANHTKKTNRDIKLLEDLNPSLEFSKDRLIFINDLIFFCSPIAHFELIQILIYLFGDNSYDNIKTYLGLLAATDEISREGSLYRSKRTTTLLNFNPTLVTALQSAFKVSYFRYSEEKVKCQLSL